MARIQYITISFCNSNQVFTKKQEKQHNTASLHILNVTEKQHKTALQYKMQLNNFVLFFRIISCFFLRIRKDLFPT